MLDDIYIFIVYLFEQTLEARTPDIVFINKEEKTFR